MNIKEFAKMLNGREYMHEMTREEEQMARKLGYVIVFGYSDDNVEFKGAINAEVGCWGNSTILIDDEGIYTGFSDECHNCKLWRGHAVQCKKIKVFWCADDDFCWTYETDIPHETFEIYEDGEKFCRGIVFEHKKGMMYE